MAHDRAHPSRDADHSLSEAAEAVAQRVDSPLDRFVIRLTGWFAEHPRVRLALALTALLGALIPGIVLLFKPDLTDSLAGSGYAGVFLTNLASTATLFIPVPGLTGAAQLLIIKEADRATFPWLVGVAGGLGMAVGEVTAYYAGFLGAELARGRELPGPKRFHATIERVVRAIDWLMDRWGMATLFVLSVIPNPLFEVAGITAGSVRMPMKRFLPSVTAGKIIRGLLLAYLGQRLPFV
ncbi:MAG TPA: VTT domain-containing protein [Dehalococcoidia bacterium]|jgi:membrane protein DedA with SNARE-associated domain